ncbi:MAG: hypothetical protein KAR20_23475 [Candidatus Heimdallarchaeota archaeon]|nr:hypothetical protein [Candidatus Heimdallarchaeota archaeon]
MDVIRIGRGNQRKLRNQRNRTKICETPLNQSEKVFWARIVKIDRVIVAELRDMKFHPIHPALKQLHHKISEQKVTRQFDYRELFYFLNEQMKEIHTRRY